ncbi:prolyl aminopeptidase [Marinicellulosiphila megalodicopiae]|uniref:prolyl aminopeptidase n=1 Tax=Marinicellulosiphila megalodicopiae TaxID=2724896 RepID=UPI003BB080DF
MHSLFADIKPFSEHTFERQGHRIYFEQSGNPNGIPVCVVHGGPGGGSNAKLRSFFNPNDYHIIMFDQRGCGQSRPHALLEHNSMNNLIQDMEDIRTHLNIDKWMLFGGSWGTTLSLVYSQKYPNNVLGLILRGVFLAREQEYKWLYDEGASRIFPDQWQLFTDHVNGRTGAGLLEAYYEQLTSKNEIQRMAAARAWVNWEGSCSTLKPSKETITGLLDPRIALPMALISVHFFLNYCFIEENQIINNMSKIAHIPAVIVHGRYDMVCPLDNATELYKHWDNCELDIIREAGHSAFEPSIRDALLKACVNMAKQLGKQDSKA